MVDTPHVLQGARLVVTGQVATAVESRTGNRRKRIREEALGGQRRAVEVTLGQAELGTDAQLADAIGGQQLETAVEYIQRATIARPANRHTERITGIRQLALMHAGHHGGLCRPVGVDQAHAAQAGRVPGAQPFHRHGLAAHMHLAQVTQGATIGRALLGQQVPVGRRQVSQGHALLDDFPCQLPGIPQFIATHDQRGAHTQRRVALFDKAVETEGRELQHAVLCTQLAVDLGAVAELAEGRMVDGHALGLAGGARGVDYVRQIGSGSVGEWVADRVAGQLGTGDGEVQTGQPLRQRQVGQQPGFAEQQVQAAVRQHVGQAVGGIVRVQGHIGRTAFEHGQQADDQLRAAPRRQAHALARARAQFQQAMGEPVGMGIELGIAQARFASLYRQRVRCGSSLGRNAFVHAQLALGSARRLAQGKHVALCGGVKQLQVAKGRLGIREQLHQQVVQVGAQACDLFSAEPRPVVTELQAQAGPQLNAQGQRVMGAFMVVNMAKRQACGCALLQGLGHREVFEHQQSVEQCALLAGPALYVVQRHMLVVTQAEIQGLQLVEPLGGRLGWRRRTDDRQRVDEQAQLLLDPRQRCRTPGDSRAKGHAILTGVALQQQAPRSLQHRIESDFLATGELAEGLCELALKDQLMLSRAQAIDRRAQRLREQGGCLQRRQGGFPERLTRRLLLQPAEVIAELPQRRGQGLAGIVGDDFTQQLGVTPTVHEDVVAGEDQMPGVTGAPHQHQAKQRRSIKREALLAFSLGKRIEVGIDVFDHVQLHVDLTLDDLMGTVQAQPVEAAAQNVMAVQCRLPGAAERQQVEAVDIHAQLVDVRLGFWRVEGMEQHALLHRRQRIKVGNRRPRHGQRVQLLLGQARQWEVRRGNLPCRGGSAMLDQGLELCRVVIRQLLHSRHLEHLATEPPLQRQLTAVHLPFHRQPIGQRCLGILGLAAALGRRYKQRGFVELAVELAQVVEGNAWRGQVRQGFAGRRRAEVAQQTVADAFGGHGAQLLLDRLDRGRQLAVGLQAYREQAGEPAHGAGQVDTVEQVFAAMAFQLDQCGGLAAPTADHPRQGGEQQVVDLSTVGRWRVLEQLTGVFGVKAYFELAAHAVLQAALEVVARQVRVRRLRLPVRQLVVQRKGMGLQLFGPQLVGAGLGRQRCLAVSLLQVFQDDAPGHAIDRQVMDHQQQALAAIGHAHQRGTQQRALRQVEAALGLIAQRRQLIVAAGLCLPQARRGDRRGIGLLPGVGLLHKTQAQGVVMVDHLGQGGFQARRFQALARGQQQRLVPVVTRGDRLGEKALLHRGEDHLAAGGTLVDHGGVLEAGHQRQAAHALVLEQVARAEANPRLARATDHLDGDDRIAAQFKKVVVQAHLLDAEHIAPDRRQGFLQVVLRRDIGLLWRCIR
ncbi:hypothetical protein FX984_06134 [Pseudomonas marginalis]|nr:hypothetical protein FX984_06134 [Pseudomonas marginalis]